MSVYLDQALEKMAMPLRSFIIKRVANEQDAEEILQEVLIKTYTGINTLKDNDKIYKWMYQITRNAIIDYYRKNAKSIEYTELFEGLEVEPVEEQNSNKDIAGCLSAMIEDLPDIYRQAILLTEFNGITGKELSEALGLSISGAKSRVQRARKMLKEKLASCCNLEFDCMGNIIDYRHKKDECKYC